MDRPTQPYVTFGTVVSASSTEPTDPDTLTYEIEVYDPGTGAALRWTGVRPAYRVTEDVDEPVDVVPFATKQRVIVTVDPTGGSDQMQIHEQERIAWEACP